MSKPIFKKEHLKGYSVINGPGTYKLKVANTVNRDRIFGEGSSERYLVNLRAGFKSGLMACVEKMGNREVVDFSEVGQFFLTGAIWAKDVKNIEDLPTKGETVIATFDFKDFALVCVRITLIPRVEPETFDLDAVCRTRELFKNLLELKK